MGIEYSRHIGHNDRDRLDKKFPDALGRTLRIEHDRSDRERPETVDIVLDKLTDAFDSFNPKEIKFWVTAITIFTFTASIAAYSGTPSMLSRGICAVKSIIF